MPASEQAYPAGPDGEPHLATVSREDLGHVATLIPERGQLSGELDQDLKNDGIAPEDRGFDQPEPIVADPHDTGPDN